MPLVNGFNENRNIINSLNGGLPRSPYVSLISPLPGEHWSKVSDIITRLVDLCKPVFEQYSIRINEVREFKPLRVNRFWGRCWPTKGLIELLIRLGPDGVQYRPFPEVLGTFIHELAHMKVIRHNAEFKRVMSAMSSIVNKFMLDRGMRGNSGGPLIVIPIKFETFCGVGHQLGGDVPKPKRRTLKKIRELRLSKFGTGQPSQDMRHAREEGVIMQSARPVASAVSRVEVIEID